MTPADLIAAVRTAHGIPSNYRLAKVLGVTEQTVSRWHSGQNAPDDDTTERLADMAGLDPEVVVVAMRAHREHTPEGRARWERIAARLARAPALTAVMAAVLAAMPSPDVHAAPAAQSAVDRLFIMSNTGGIKKNLESRLTFT